MRLAAGYVAGHDAQTLRDFAPNVDVIVLTQASMARAAALVQDWLHPIPVLTSAEIGMQHVAAHLSAQAPNARNISWNIARLAGPASGFPS